MNLLIKLSNDLISEALRNLLEKTVAGYQIFVDNNNSTIDHFKPDIIITDFNNINAGIFSRYPESKIILIDTGLKQDEIIAVYLHYKIYGVLNPKTDAHLCKKALGVVSKGEIWIDNDTIKAFLHDAELLSKTGKIKGITEKEKEVIEYICQGYRNKEIASRLTMSEHTVKAHLNRIFRKFNVSSRSQLIALNRNSISSNSTQNIL